MTQATRWRSRFRGRRSARLRPSNGRLLEGQRLGDRSWCSTARLPPHGLRHEPAISMSPSRFGILVFEGGSDEPPSADRVEQKEIVRIPASRRPIARDGGVEWQPGVRDTLIKRRVVTERGTEANETQRSRFEQGAERLESRAERSVGFAQAAFSAHDAPYTPHRWSHFGLDSERGLRIDHDARKSGRGRLGAASCRSQSAPAPGHPPHTEHATFRAPRCAAQRGLAEPLVVSSEERWSTALTNSGSCVRSSVSVVRPARSTLSSACG